LVKEGRLLLTTGDLVLNTTMKINISRLKIRVLAASVLIALPLYLAAGQTDDTKAGSAKAAADSLPDGPGKEVVLKKCISCHSVQIVTNHHADADDWAQVVSKMIGRGAVISDDDADTIVDYLSAHFGPPAHKAD